MVQKKVSTTTTLNWQVCALVPWFLNLLSNLAWAICSLGLVRQKIQELLTQTRHVGTHQANELSVIHIVSMTIFYKL